MTTYNQDEEIGFDEPKARPYAMPASGHPTPAVQHAKLPAEMPDLGDDTGFEGTRMEEQTTPFLRMAQGMSPELKPSMGQYIPGLIQGMIFNTATREAYQGPVGVDMLVCFKEHHYGRWIPRDLNGGGYRGAVSPDDPLVRQTLARMAEKYGSSARFKMPRFKDGHWSDPPPVMPDTKEEIELVETGQLYVLYADGRLTSENAKRAIVACTSTALGAYTGWVGKHMNASPPRWWAQGKPGMARIFDYRWRLTTFLDKRGNNDFYNYRITLMPEGATFEQSMQYAQEDPALYKMAADFYLLAKGGGVKVDETAHASAVGGDGSAGDDVPF